MESTMEKETVLKVTVDQHKCIGAGQCVIAAPAVFDQSDDDGIVILLQENPSEDARAEVELAAKLCPAAAITVH
ncbi:ferredoxin [Granulicoccus phenolivorans]|uniref:ferredoxin n=1 Tax=Granulicoccus phenolivorans TaxID=266854 RepID=UPI0003F90FCC|nr:ferredoxin [Granulicoccus phenolivorans]